MDMNFSPLTLSIKAAFIATCITSILGIILAYLVINIKGRYKSLLDGILTLPLILPPTVVGFFLLLIFGKNSPIGKIFLLFDKSIIFSFSATVIAATVVSFPMMYRTTRSAFEQIDSNIISSARTLGISEFKIFYKISIPLAMPGIIAGIILSFARAMGEFGATLMLAGNIPNKTQTIPLAIFFAVESGDMKTASIWVIIIIFISFISIFVLNYWSEKQLKIIGRK